MAGTAGAVSVVGLARLVVSFLLKKLPNIELLFVDLGAFSRVEVPVTGSVGDVVAGSTVAVEAPVGAASPLVLATVVAAVDSKPPNGSTGDPITRAARGSVSLEQR